MDERREAEAKVAGVIVRMPRAGTPVYTEVSVGEGVVEVTFRDGGSGGRILFITSGPPEWVEAMLGLLRQARRALRPETDDAELRGRTAFEAYNAEGPNAGKTFDGRPVPTWGQLGDSVRAKWRAAARALVGG